VSAPLPALFLDRDGTLIEEVNYLACPDQVALTPGAGEAVARVNRAGMPVVVVTNQAGVGRGYFPESAVGEVHECIATFLRAHGARIDGFYYCPHHPEAKLAQYRIACECRKPAPGMLLRAARELGVDLARSYMVGDRETDLEAGRRAGAQSILVRTGYGARVVAQGEASYGPVALVADDLAEAVGWIVGENS
jgi:D-glycero-D-manno-heptose 1,7-bisphosphate phosphatase